MYQCFICHHKIPTYKLLVYHVTRKHNVLSYKQFTCNQQGCIRVFSSAKVLYRHIRNKHSINASVDTTVNTATPINTPTCQTAQYIDPSQGVHESNNDERERNKNEELLPMYDLNEVAFLLSMFSQPSLTRTNVFTIAESTKLLLDSKSGATTNCFENLDSEYKFQKALKSLDLWAQPSKCVLDYSETVTKFRNNDTIKMKSIDCQVISLKSLFKMVLSVPHILEIAKQYMSSKSDTLGDAKDGYLLEDLPENVFPFILFFDEIETGNPLGSHKGVHKMGMIYVSLRCFPPHLYSKLCNIFLYVAIPSSALTYLNKLLLQIVEEVTELSDNGIDINGVTYKFRLLGITGDNLGQHQLLGLVTGFTANFPCRVCKASREMCQRSCNEDESLLRNEVNYAEDVTTNDVSKTGVKQECVLNKIPNFHVTRNYIFDIMHDILEGVGNFGMCAVLNYYVEKKVFTLEFLNERIRLFSFSTHANRPPLLTLRNLQKDDLSYSASEMLNLLIHFSLIIGDMVPLNCPVWQYYLTLRNIINLLMLKSISVSYINYLDVLITEHHSMYISLFKKKLKPKHHYLLHYKRALLKTGPLCHNWAMRFESKNFQIKLFSNVIRSRVNLSKSIAIRYAYLFANDIYRWRSASTFQDIEKVGPVYDAEGIGSCVKWVVYRGVHYDIGSVVCILESSHHDMPVYATIAFMKISSNSISFIVKEYTTVCYHEHLSAYVIEENTETYCCMTYSEISFPLSVISREEVLYVADMHF